ncbi:cationic peroxidase 1-like [Salvia splendens]|uniref:cationic peroxidase 1-like n=1 Tax=Salvia splendens TaxID=180675 RepID=UPI001C266E9F|nr:cationic peroxidase 1-like [Salvia splendens]
MAILVPQCLARLMLILLLIGVSNAQLSSNFYSSSCPNLLSIIRTAVNSAVSSDSRMGASLLRLHFHDCFVALKGPSWAIALGRRDSTTASLSNANSQIPGPGNNLNALITAFSNKGFTAREMVALSGSHTIGQARCTTFRNRIYNEANINATFATSTRANCPRSGGDNTLSPLDVATPTAFNNDYYRNLISLKGLLHSDQQLFNNGSTDAQVRAYSTNSASFFNDFAAAMVKMTNLSPLTGTNGQIRRNCRRTN